MKVEIVPLEGFVATALSKVDFGQFATDIRGNIYFAPNHVWLSCDPISGKISWASSLSDIYVTPLPYGTKLTLTSEKYL